MHPLLPFFCEQASIRTLQCHQNCWGKGMPQEITARLSEQISNPELSKMWESERTTFNPGTGDGIHTPLSAPEVDIQARGNDVVLRFPTGGPDPEHRRLKDAFERAIHRYRPDVTVDWAA